MSDSIPFPEPPPSFEEDPEAVDPTEGLVQATQATLGNLLDALAEKNESIATQQAGDILKTARTPPHAMDAERAVLGGLLLDPRAFDEVMDEGLAGEDFYRQSHGVIYACMGKLHNHGEPIDTLTVTDALMKSGEIEQAGGAAAIAQLASLLPTTAHVRAHAKLVREKALLRRMIEAATGIVTNAYRNDKKVAEVVDEAERAILAISERSTRKGFIPIDELVKRVTAKLEQMYEQKSAVTGIPTGFVDLDKYTSGFQPGDLVIVAARPSMGKTAFTLNITTHVAMREQRGVAFFSCEMGSEQLVMRMVGAEARIDLGNLKRGFIKQSEFSELVRASGELGDAPMYIDETPSLSIGEMRNKCRRLKQRYDIDLIIVDYLQLMHGPPGMDNKATEVGEISRGLKAIARELKVPVIALSQLNRQVEQRADRRPMLSDLRESGAIEQDADVIAFLYREEYYLQEKTPEDKLGTAELIVAKHRNGPTGVVNLRFFNNITRFENLDRSQGDYAP
ncbi:MAG: replicative DNA helicase [Myxococcales bacterium]|nr:replicative DNA helicase [Myxococcales bacterium]|tara:strand:- start:2870 stop:4393 length:1524 start_codon:yes stop_codon:yes gene_type:complete